MVTQDCPLPFKSTQPVAKRLTSALLLNPNFLPICLPWVSMVFRADLQPGCYFPHSQSPSKQLEDFQFSPREPPLESLPSSAV
jgi:hypothetical protein